MARKKPEPEPVQDAPPTSGVTKVTTMRLTPTDLANIDVLRALAGLTDRTEAVRFAVRESLWAAQKRAEKTKPKE